MTALQITNIKLAFLFLLYSTSIYGVLNDNPALSSFNGTWKLLEANYYLGGKLIQHKGDMNIAFSITVENGIMKWVSKNGTVKNFFFDMETGSKTVTTAKYRDHIICQSESQRYLVHSVDRKYTGSTRKMKVKNTFELKNNGKTMHHLFEDFNGKEVYKVHSIFGRDSRTVHPTQ